MSIRSKFVTASALCVLTSFCRTSLAANDSADWKAVETSYAEANLALAEARLAQAQSENATDTDSVSAETIDSLEAGVQLAQAQVKQLNSGDAANTYAAQIMAAEQELLGLKKDYNDSLAANKQQAGAVSDSVLRRQQAEVAVAKARLAAYRALAKQPAEVRIQWQIGQLQDQIRALWARPLIED